MIKLLYLSLTTLIALPVAAVEVVDQYVLTDTALATGAMLLAFVGIGLGMFRTNQALRSRGRAQYRELKRAQETSQQQLALIDRNIMLSRTDLDGRIFYASEALAKQHGCTSESLIGKDLRALSSKEIPESQFKQIRESLLSQGKWQGELLQSTSYGGSYWAHLQIEQHKDRFGQVAGYTEIRQNISALKKLEELWRTDQLTGLINRASLDELWVTEIRRSQRYSTPLSVALIDVDHFKRVNDTLGHLAGDQLLYELANLMKTQLREVDYLGRWGGEEFMLILPNTQLADALTVVEKLRSEVAKKQFSHMKGVTISIGLATYAKGSTGDELFKLADQALYKAKARGRNRIELGHTTITPLNKDLA